MAVVTPLMRIFCIGFFGLKLPAMALLSYSHRQVCWGTILRCAPRYFCLWECHQNGVFFPSL